MDCKWIEQELNKLVFGEDKRELFIKLSESPERFIGLFRPTKPYTKIIQFLLQSHEIKFGGAMEEIIYRIFMQEDKLKHSKVEKGKNVKLANKDLDIDIFIEDDENAWIIEMKLRDDHDSSKRTGQIDNFKMKIEAILRDDRYKARTINAIMYFVDDSMGKNKNYYLERLEKIHNEFNVGAYIFYGKELFEYFGIGEKWTMLIECLKVWKDKLPDFPVLDYDAEHEDSFEILKEIPVSVWEKILSVEELWVNGGVINSLFKTGATLKKLCEYFSKYEGRLKKVYDRISKDLCKKVENLYN